MTWVDAAFRAMRAFHDPGYPARYRQPILSLRRAQFRRLKYRDRTIWHAVARRFATRGDGAQHEILMEQDRYRSQFWAAFDAFVPGTPLY